MTKKGRQFFPGKIGSAAPGEADIQFTQLTVPWKVDG